MAKFEATVDEIVYRNEQNGFTVAMVRPDAAAPIAAVGIMPFLAAGERARFEGDEVEHREYGRQIKVTSYESVMPESGGDIEKYLSSGLIKGIGPVMAKFIVNRFGKETFEIMEAQPARLTEIPGIGPKRAQLIAKSFAENMGTRNTMMFLQSLGMSLGLAGRVCSKFGDMTESVVRANPYRLADEVEGVGFRTADHIAFLLGFSRESRVRLLSGIGYVLNEAVGGEGHVYLPRAELTRRSMEILGADEDSIQNALDELIMDGRLIAQQIEGEPCVYLPRLYDAERETALRIKTLMAANIKARLNPAQAEAIIAQYEAQSGVTLAGEQREAVLAAAFNGVTVITGGPGTGKTTSIRCLIRLMTQTGRVELCAPTGRAAKRMSEATGCPARTIHRMLEYGGEDEGFGRDAENPMDADAIIVDETSMVDIFLMRALLRAIKPGSRLVLVGDADQLPSVGAGNVLRDLIESGTVSVVKLTEIFRQAAQSNIIMNAHRINRGENPVIVNRDTDFFLERRPSAQACALSVVALVKERLPRYLGVDSLRDIQVMAPMKKGCVGVFELNRLIQRELNPPAPTKPEMVRGDTTFRLGDKVMQIKNNYDIEWEKEGDEGKGIFNGDIGYVTDVKRDSHLTVEFDDGRRADYELGPALDELELAYCMSVHKSQGSEFEAVVLPLISGPPMLMTRNLLYTAVTRARKLVVLVGSEDCVRRMVANNHIDMRYSALELRLRKA